MTSIQGKIVFITGASAGIGKACAEAFAAAGARLVLSARRLDKVQQFAEELRTSHKTESHVFQLDVRDQKAVESAICALPAEWADIDILVNNAGLSRGLDKLSQGSTDDWDEMIDTNVKGLLYVSRAVLPGMLARNSGHVINLGSIAGFETYPNGAVYCATKAAVRSINDGMKMDLLGTPIRVTAVEPGLVETEFSIVRFHGDANRAAKVYQGISPLTPEDVADVVLFCATRPAHVNIRDVIMLSVDQAGATMVNRRS